MTPKPELTEQKLISTLQEASGHPIEDLKKVIGKDPRIKMILQKHVDLDSIQNKAEFLNTVKFFLLNNRNVLEFVDGRDYVNAVDNRSLKKLRELRPAELTQKDLDALIEFTASLFREHAHVERSGMTPGTRKDILDWVNKSGRYFDLSRATQKELESIPGVRPTRPILLYRGLLFSAADLKERKRYDGQLEIGAGLKFLRSIREGSRIVDLEWDRASSWSTSKDIAAQFAKFGPANSNFEATLNWLSNSNKGKIHGDLGFIISTLAQPEDVLLDVSRFVTQAHMKHGGEGEVILKPGEYTCRISTKFDKTGEIDPIKSGEVSESVQDAVQAVQAFAEDWKVPESEGLGRDDWGRFDVERLIRDKDIQAVLGLTKKSLRVSAERALQELQELYRQHLEHLTAGQLETLQADRDIGPLVQWMLSVRKGMMETSRHAAHKSPSNTRGTVKIADMTPAQYRESKFTGTHDALKAATAGGRFTEYSTGKALENLLQGFTGVKEQDLHRRGRKEQEEIVDKVISGFYKQFNIQQPADREEAITGMKQALLAAERNSGLLRTLTDYREGLDKALETKADASAE